MLCMLENLKGGISRQPALIREAKRGKVSINGRQIVPKILESREGKPCCREEQSVKCSVVDFMGRKRKQWGKLVLTH
tara:strand:+ start:8431 stop:8661 length:231 start_codon:yes stop_codon:yes gene_type:complete